MLVALHFTAILIALKLTSALSVVPVDNIIINYCPPSQCPGCPPWPQCDCVPGPVLLPEVSSDSFVADSVVTLPVEPEPQPAQPDDDWYVYTPVQRKIRPLPCKCPDILCVAPPLCEC